MSDWLILLLPLAAGWLILLSHLPLGEQVLKRGIVFIDLAIAQLAALGGVFAPLLLQWLSWPPALLTILAGVMLALAGSGIVALICRYLPAHREALIGLLYAGSASLLMIAVAYDPQGNRALAQSLSGDILWVAESQLIWLLLATPLAWLGCRKGNAALFYPAFAVLVTLSVPVLGVYLVFSTLIVPALVSRILKGVRWAGWLTGALGYLCGLMLSYWTDWPTGASIVLSLLLTGLVVCGVVLSFQSSRSGRTVI